MKSFGGKVVCSIFRVSALAAVCAMAAHGGACQQSGPQTTYQFVGQCTDCTGTGVGLLTLQNYTLGTALGNCNFVSFSYSSNLTSFTVTPANLSTPNGLTGTLPASLPSTAQVQVGGSGNNVLISETNGSWNVGERDYGSSSSWGLAPSVPAVSVPMLIVLAVMLALIGAILLKWLPQRREA